MKTNEPVAVAAFFDKQWDLYQRAIRAGVLCHSEMFATLNQFLRSRFANQPFRFVDFGCGDGSAVLDTLVATPVRHYIGVDAASNVIVNAEKTLESLKCEKTLICQDMFTAIHDIPRPADVIFCSYSLHHLTLQQKTDFIQDCYDSLSSPGYFVLVDGVSMEQESREEWLDRLDQRFVDIAHFNEEERSQIMKHPRELDFPESMATFRNISQKSPWRNFEVLFERDDFLAFMVFTK